MKYSLLMATIITALAYTASVSAEDKAADIAALADQYVASSFQQGDNQDPSRLVQDETQKACSVNRNKPSAEEVKAIMEREKATIKYPEDGKMMGDWEEGKKHYTAGFAMRIGRVEPDKADKARGGNCYACHAADPKEVAAGNLGPSLVNFGKNRGNTEATIKYTYEKIYNAQAYVPCSNMPRLGHNGVLTPTQIADIVAFLVDPASPVNK